MSDACQDTGLHAVGVYSEKHGIVDIYQNVNSDQGNKPKGERWSKRETGSESDFVFGIYSILWQEKAVRVEAN
jgi:hypothetical protein